MKRLLTILLLSVCGIFVYAQDRIVLENNQSKSICTHDSFEKFSAAFSFESIEGATLNTEKGDFTQIFIEGTFPTGDEGAPQLPAFRKLIAIPQGATPAVVVTSYTEEEYDLADYEWNKIFPNQPSVRKDMEPEDIKFVYQEKAYAAKGYEDRAIAQVQELGTMRNIRIGALTVNPVIYDAGSNKIKVRNNVEVEVVFEGADKAATQNLFESTYSIYFEPVYKQFFNKGVYEDHPDLYKTPVHMLVVANRMFEETLQPWIEWKTKKGFYMDVNYTDDIGTTAAAIKTFCQTKYNDGVANGTTPSFLVLVGDVAQVEASATGSKTAKKTDLYYGSVDGDYFPDMYYSRMSATNTTQLESIIEKILYYEQYQFEDPSYLDNVLLIAGADGTWNPRVGQPQINYATTYYYNAEHGFANIHKYLNSYSGCYNNLANVGFANYTAHCGETSWGDPSFTISGVNALTNENKYFVAMGNCCLAADFGYGECIGEAFVRGNKKGAVGYIGSSPSSYWGEDFHFTVGAYSGSITTVTTPTLENTSDGCYDLCFREADFHCLSSMVFGGNLSVTHAGNTGCTMHIGIEYYWQAYNVLGDGSLMPYWSQGAENTVSHMEIVPIGMDYYEVSADPGSYVAISKDGVLYGAASVDESGTVQVPLNPPITSGGDVNIVVTAPQRIPYMTTIPAAALEGAYLTVTEYSFDGDGILAYGETAKISMGLKNVGMDATSGDITVTISCDDPLITIVNGTATCGSVNAGETITLTDAFEITASTEVENKQSFTLNAVLTSGDDTWESAIKVTAYKPILEFADAEWGGAFELGGSLFFAVVLKNTGGVSVDDVVGVLSSTSELVTISAPEQNFGVIPENETAKILFQAEIADGIRSLGDIDFNIAMSGDDGLIIGEGSFSFANTCTVVFDMYDTRSDGWDGAAAIQLAFSDGTPNKTLKLSSGGYQQEKIVIAKDVVVTMTWIRGSYDSECYFKVSYEDGTLIYNHPQGSAPSAGVFHTLTVDCECQGGTECNYAIANLTGVIDEEALTATLSWDAIETEEELFYAIYKNGTYYTSTQNNAFDDIVGDYETEYTVSVVCSNFIESERESVTLYLCDQLANLQYDYTPGAPTLTLTWEHPVAPIETYNIYFGEELLGSLSGTENTFEVSDPDNGIYCVEAIYDGDCEDGQDCVEVDNVVGIENLSVKSFNIYPNPVGKGEQATIQLSGDKVTLSDSYLHIYDMLGRLIESRPVAGESMTITTPKTAGVYVIRVVSGNKEVENQLLIVQ